MDQVGVLEGGSLLSFFHVLLGVQGWVLPFNSAVHLQHSWVRCVFVKVVM